MEGRNHLAVRLAEGYVPGTDLGLRGRGDHKVETVRKLLEDYHRAREEPTLPVDFGTHVLAD